MPTFQKPLIQGACNNCAQHPYRTTQIAEENTVPKESPKMDPRTIKIMKIIMKIVFSFLFLLMGIGLLAGWNAVLHTLYLSLVVIGFSGIVIGLTRLLVILTLD